MLRNDVFYKEFFGIDTDIVSENIDLFGTFVEKLQGLSGFSSLPGGPFCCPKPAYNEQDAEMFRKVKDMLERIREGKYCENAVSVKYWFGKLGEYLTQKL